ncbi:MAG: hypothetical protein AAGA55_02505 [Planctomycetota bacterium]
MAQIAMSGSKAAWLAPAAKSAGWIFLGGLAASVTLGIRSAVRTRAFVRATDDASGQVELAVLEPGDLVGDLVADRTDGTLVIEHRYGLGRLRAVRGITMLLGFIAGIGASVAAGMMLGQGSLGSMNLKGILGLIGLCVMPVLVVFWAWRFRKPLVVRMLFDRADRVARFEALSGLFRVRMFELPFDAMASLSFDESDLLESRRVVLDIAGRAVEIARFAKPRTNLRRDGTGQRVDEAHRALCMFRADRIFMTIDRFIAS